MKPLELYIHIPFCVQKCKYCDFLSAPSSIEEQKKYVESLCLSLCSYKRLAKVYQIVTIFIGGGTPSLLHEDEMCHLFDTIHRIFKVVPEAEISIEMNPGTVTKEKLHTYRQIGINRLSIGLQSTNNEELKQLGRIHTFEDFHNTYRLARVEGFNNLNIDLMSAIPNQTLTSWKETLHSVAALNPEHISAYSLIIEEGTPFYEYYRDSKHAEELPTEEVEREMYGQTQRILSDYGYNRYEISNYAKKNYECQHNLGYWNRREYLGIGLGAASLISNCRFVEGEAPKGLSLKEQMEEFIFLGLRKTEGISEAEFLRAFKIPIHEVFGSILERQYQQGLILFKSGKVRLSERGLDISNYVMSEFLL